VSAVFGHRPLPDEVDATHISDAGEDILFRNAERLFGQGHVDA